MIDKKLIVKAASEVKKLAERRYIERDVDMTQCVAFAQRNESIAFERMMHSLRAMDAVIERLERGE